MQVEQQLVALAHWTATPSGSVKALVPTPEAESIALALVAACGGQPSGSVGLCETVSTVWCVPSGLSARKLSIAASAGTV